MIMSLLARMRIATALLVVALFSIGCNPLTGAYFLMFGVDDKTPAEFRIAGEGKTTKHVMVLTSMLSESRAELLGVERQLTSKLSRQLEMDCKANKEKIQIVPAHKVEEFKANNPTWKTMTMTEIGRLFDVDYVIDVEMADVSLFERDSRKTLFLGRSALTVRVIDVAKSCDEGPVHQKQLNVQYPKARGPIPVDDDMTVQRFRELFVQRIAQDVSGQLTAHVYKDTLMQD